MFTTEGLERLKTDEQKLYSLNGSFSALSIILEKLIDGEITNPSKLLEIVTTGLKDINIEMIELENKLGIGLEH